MQLCTNELGGHILRLSTLERLFMLLLGVVYGHISQQIGHMLVHFEAKYYIDLIVSIELFGSVLTEVS